MSDLARGLRVARPVSLAALAAALLSPGLWLGPGFDAAVYTLAGVRIRDGFMPYTDLFDNKPPGLYLLNALGQAAMPWFSPWVVSWVLTFAFTAGTILIVDRLLQRRLSPLASFLLSLVCLIGIASHAIAYGGGLTESFAILPLVAALWAVSTARSGWRVSAGVACLASLACLISVQALPAGVVLVIAAVMADGDRPASVRRALAAVAGGVAVPLAVAVWLAARGALGEAVDEVVVYNSSYRAVSSGFGSVLLGTVLLLACLVVPIAIAVIRMLHSPRSFDRVTWLSLAWSLAQIASLGYENRLFLHYLILLVPPAVLLSVPGFGWLVETIKSSARRSKSPATWLAMATACMFAISATAAGGLAGITMDGAGKAEAITDDTAAWIDANTQASATVFLWGNDSYIYLVAERSPYDRFVYQFPMVTAGYWSPDRTATLLSAWVSSPPAVIVETPATVPMFRPKTDTSDPRTYDTLVPLRDFVRAHYRLAASFGNDAVSEDVYVLAPAN